MTSQLYLKLHVYVTTLMTTTCSGLTSSRREYIFFPGPPCSEKSGSMKRSPDTQINVNAYNKSPSHTHRNQNACLKVLRLSMGINLFCVYMASDANWLSMCQV